MRLPRVLESNSIQITIAVAYTLVVVFTVLFLGTTALVLTRDALWDTTTHYTDQLLVQVRTSIGDYLSEMDGIATGLLDDEDVEALIADPDRRDLLPEVRQVFDTVSRMRPDVSLLALAERDAGILIHSSDNPLNAVVDPLRQSWFRNAVASAGAPAYSGARVQNLLRDHYQWVVSLSRSRGDFVLLVDLNFRVIEQLARSVQLGPRGYLFITDADGSIIYHPQQQLIYSNLVSEPIEAILANEEEELVRRYDGDQRLYSVETVERTGWRVVAVNSVEQLLAGQRQLRGYFLSWVALCFAIVMVLTVVLSRRISLPIMRLRRSMQAVEQGQFDIDLRIERRDEIGALSRDFAIMVATVRDLMARNEREQEEKRRTEIQALQNQIAPHFLYNTLDSIVWMAEGGRMNEVIDMTTNLARLLRLSIGRGDAMVPLSKELDHVRSYLTIQQMRYRDRLRFEIEADPAVGGCRLPRLTLQPIVENAIYHGIKNRAGGGAVAVAAWPEGDDVLIEVSDDGPGIEHSVLERLRRQEIEPSGGVGLKNVHQRLALTFGDRYGLTFRSDASDGTTVRITIPQGGVQ
ncbi:MAG: cache domain-containing sensor histidine kinase [Alkalispirochaeta sp.]